jgi:hypothetical protein
MRCNDSLTEGCVQQCYRSGNTYSHPFNTKIRIIAIYVYTKNFTAWLFADPWHCGIRAMATYFRRFYFEDKLQLNRLSTGGDFHRPRVLNTPNHNTDLLCGRTIERQV